MISSLRLTVWALLAAAFVTEAGRVLAADLVLLPQSIVLDSSEARQNLIVQWRAGEQLLDQQRQGITFASSDEKVARIEDGVAIPVGNGVATLTAAYSPATGKPQTCRAEVTVKNFTQTHAWSFRNHVESVLSKQGCNGGACHGARAGQKGFRLTLFGFDVDADYSYLTRQAIGRRIVPNDPGRSLILTKPSGLLPHKGGVKLDSGSREYRVLAEWIAAGAPGPKDDDPQIARLEVLPKYSSQQAVSKPLGNTQQVLVRAHFSDGRVEDVTRWAKYQSVNAQVASVSERGLVTITGFGEGAVSVWYLNLTEMAFISSPYPNTANASRFAQEPRKNFIDEQVLAKLETLRVPPSPLCDDSTFLRRAFLDSIATLPTVAETEAFLADSAPGKREKLVDALLGRPEFVDYWALKWSDLLLLSGARLRPKALETYYQWIRQAVAENKPWDRFAYEVVTASGNTHENGPANFYALHQDPETMAETVCQAFLGLSINCAKCHNHPLEKWTNDQYYGLANLFSRVRSKGWGGDFRNGDGLRVVYADVTGELLQPSRAAPQPPRPLDGEALPFDSTVDRRIAMAQWLTTPQNPYFTRAIVNRVWANYYGVGLVERVDDLRVTNPASDEKLLQAASDYLIAEKFDLKKLMRAILVSTTYQRESRPLPENKNDERFYSRYYPKRLKAEVLLDALSQVTASPTEFRALKPDNKPGDPISAKRAIALPDSFVDSYFLKTFGRPDRLITCDCERSDEPSVTQAFHLHNGETLNKKLQAKECAVSTAASEKEAGKIIDQLYLAAFCRKPAPEQRERLAAVIEAETEPAARRLAIEDLYWSVLSSKEFVFNY